MRRLGVLWIFEATPANGTPFDIWDDKLTKGELRAAVLQMSHRRCRGALAIRKEHIKAWLHREKKEEDPESEGKISGNGKTWQNFVCLCTSVSRKRTIPQQMCWVIIILIPKGGGNRGIGLMEPIWKVPKRVMDHRLETIILHDSIHKCLKNRGTV
jgi:hypothetical protein